MTALSRMRQETNLFCLSRIALKNIFNFMNEKYNYKSCKGRLTIGWFTIYYIWCIHGRPSDLVLEKEMGHIGGV